jgi:hypothetical protein
MEIGIISLSIRIYKFLIDINATTALLSPKAWQSPNFLYLGSIDFNIKFLKMFIL